jgi:hypothetical protein
MPTRLFGPLTALLVAVAGASAVTPVASGQARSAGAPVSAGSPGKGLLPARTPDGHPDLQGTWDFRTLTPLERPGDLAGKQVLTDEEAAALEQRAAQNRVDRAPRTGDPGTYNQFWFDFGTTVLDSKRTSLIVDPADGRLPTLTPSAEKRAAERAETTRRPAAGPEDRTLWERCLLGFNSGPPMMPSGYNNNFQLIQTSEYVVILNEMVHDARIVPLGTRPHGTIRQWMGDSRGRWEGDTLVIETVNFTRQGTGTIGLRASADENLRLVERLTPTGANTLVYEFMVDDPTVWARPWTAAIPMKKTDDHIYEYACHEGNHGMVGILRGARADEKAAEEAAKKQLK